MRITAQNRRYISKLVAAHKYDPLIKAADKEWAAISLEAYRKLVTWEDEKTLDGLMVKYRGIVHTNSLIRFRKEPEELGRSHIYFSMTHERPMPASVPPHDEWMEILGEIAIRAMTNYKRRQELNDERVTAERVIESSISKMRTVKQVEAQWPEILPFVREALGEIAPISLPALNVSELNEKFGLPLAA